MPEPAVDADVAAQDLEASARRELRALGRANAENVARHLVMVQRLLDSDPQLAYEHARYAVAHAGRIAVVRESAGIAAYLAGHYQDALRDIRAARRLCGVDLHRAIEADCERGLGNLERALKVAESADRQQLDDVEEAEIAMVVSGVRHEMGQTELGLLVIEEAIMMFRGDRQTLRRLHAVRADRLEELGRNQEAQSIRQRIGDGSGNGAVAPPVEVFDMIEESTHGGDAESADRPGRPERAVTEDAPDRADQPINHHDGAEGTGDGVPAPEPSRRAGAVLDADGDEPAEEDHWSASFSQRVQEEMDELLAHDSVTPPPGERLDNRPED